MPRTLVDVTHVLPDGQEIEVQVNLEAPEQSVLDVLNSIDEFYSGPERWIQGQWGKYAGREIDACDGKERYCNADCLCLSGAMVRERYRINPPHGSNSYYDAGNIAWMAEIVLNLAAGSDPYRGIVNYNDAPTTTFEEVKRTIARAKELVPQLYAAARQANLVEAELSA